jgi:hypothetical protein
MQFPLSSYYLLSLRYKHSPQHPVLRHPESIIYLYCEIPSFPPIKRTLNILFNNVVSQIIWLGILIINYFILITETLGQDCYDVLYYHTVMLGEHSYLRFDQQLQLTSRQPRCRSSSYCDIPEKERREFANRMEIQPL